MLNLVFQQIIWMKNREMKLSKVVWKYVVFVKVLLSVGQKKSEVFAFIFFNIRQCERHFSNNCKMTPSEKWAKEDIRTYANYAIYQCKEISQRFAYTWIVHSRSILMNVNISKSVPDKLKLHNLPSKCSNAYYVDR